MLGFRGLVVLLSAGLFLTTCTDVDIFETPGVGDGQSDNKLTIKGEFCTEHPDELSFPVKIMFIIDCSQSMNVTDPAPSPGEFPGRVQAVLDVVQKFANDPGVEFAIVRFEAAANVATQRDTNGDNVADMFGFVKDMPTLLRALNSLVAAGGNTSYQAALGLAEATLAMDMTNASVDERARSKYVIIFLSDGLPYPVGYGVNTPASIRQAVEEMMNLAKRFDVSDLTLHTALLSVNMDPDVEEQAELLLKENMAKVGGGTYRNFKNGEEINFLDIDYTSVKRMYAMKDGAFLVSNANAHPGWDVSQSVDTDGDGLVDALEEELGTHLGLIDTDGDGFNDLLEYNLRRSGFDPLDPDDADCSLGLDRLDNDGDGLLNCEERFLGTSLDLFDTDADGLPDPIEVRSNTNPVWGDAEVDLDYDGTLNANEVAWHTDPAFNDANRFSKLAYRYSFGRKPGIFESRLCYQFEVKNVTLEGTRARQPGEPDGFNDIMVYAGQVPYDDPDDYGTFRVACARVRYVPRFPEPDIKYPPNGKVEFEQKDFKRPTATPCSSDEQCRHHVCDPNSHLCLEPLGDACDRDTPCPNFTCEADPFSGESFCVYPVATACLAEDDCPSYPVHPETGLCQDPAHSTPDASGACPRRECIPSYLTCTDTANCPADGDDNPDNDAECLNGYCRVPCFVNDDCNPGETCEADLDAFTAGCTVDADCSSATMVCAGGACRESCGIDADCPNSTDTCEDGGCVSHHCVSHQGGSCAKVACSADSDCLRQTCDPEVGRCRTQPCLDSRECPNQHCELVLGVCVDARCAADRDCRGNRGFSCNEMVGEPCLYDIDCPFNFCSLEVKACAMGGATCAIVADCPTNTCDLSQGDDPDIGECTLSGNDCTNDLECAPNMCQSYYVCSNDPTKNCTTSMDCPPNFCSTEGHCINNTATACNPDTEKFDNNCQMGMCSREGGIGNCDTLGQEACSADDDCPHYECNPSTGLCLYPNEVVCQITGDCPAGLDCSVTNPAPDEWGVCQKQCASDDDCPHAFCQGRCRPADPLDHMRCTDWFDAERDCKVYYQSSNDETDAEEPPVGP